MKILHIVDYIGPHGGLYQILEKLERYLTQYGIENSYLALKETPYELDQKLVTLDMDVLEEGKFYEYVDSQNADIIHIHSDIENEYFEYCIEHYKTIRSIFDWGPFCPRPVFDNAFCACDATFKEARDDKFIEEHCLSNECVKIQDLPRFKKKIELLKRVDKLVVLSDANKEYLVKMGIEEKLIYKMPPIMEPPKDYVEPPQENILLFAGRIVYHKGTEFLLKSLVKVKNKNWKLILEGTGDTSYVTELMRFAVENEIDDKITITGHKPYLEYREMFRKVKLLVFPSVYAEGFGYPAYEAMLNGVPIIAFEGIGGVREWLRNDYNGIVVPFQDVDKMAAAIENLLDDNDLYMKYRNNSIEWSKSVDFAQEIKDMMDMYSSIYIEEKENEKMEEERKILEACMRKSFQMDENVEIDFDKNLDEYGVNSISFIKMLVLLEKELKVEFDENTFNFSDYRTPNQIVEYIKQLKK